MAFYRVCGNYYGTDNDANSLKHYRTPGSKNGVRKYQYEDGTLTPAGRIHYGVGKGGAAKSATAYTDTGTGRGPSGLGRLAYKIGGVQGYANYRKASSNVSKAAKGVGKTASSMARDASRWGEQAVKDAGKAAKNAGDWVDNRASDVKNWGSQAVNDVKRFVGAGGTREAAEEARSRSNETRDRLTAENAKRIQDNELINQQRADKQFGPSQKYADQFNENLRINYVDNQRQIAEAGREARAAEEAHYNTVAGRAEKTYKDVSKAVDDAKTWVGERASDVKNWGDQAGKDIGKAVDDAKSWVGDRASDVKKWGDQAGKDIGKAASDVKTWGEQAAKDVGKAAKNAGDWVGERAKDVGKAAKNAGDWVGERAKDVAKWGEGAVNKGRDFISGLFGKKKK